MPYFELSAEKDADAYLKMKENMDEDLSLPRFEEAHADTNALAEVVIAFPGQAPLTCVVSKTEQPILDLEPNKHKVQITTKSIIGQCIAKNLHQLKVGMKLPNGAEIREIIHPKCDN